MDANKWQYYNHAAVPTIAPHEEVDITPINDGSIWKLNGKPYLARWSSDWDCGYETEWWFVIKDVPFDIADLKAKRRYEINKGRRNYSVKIINPAEFREELFRITINAYSQWPEKYRPNVDKENFLSGLSNWSRYTVFAAFDNETQCLSGYAIIDIVGKCINFNVLRVNPDAEKKGINAAIVAGLLEKYNDYLSNGFYICDGSRAIRHETAFQDYLEKYFGFRKAFCRLNIKYRFPINIAIRMLYPFRRKIHKNTRLSSSIYGVLLMEEISRSFRLGEQRCTV